MFANMFQNAAAKSITLAAVSALSLAVTAGTASAADRGGHADRGDRGDHGGHGGHGDVRVGFHGGSRFGFGISLNLGNGYWGGGPYYGYSYAYRPYCAPIVYRSYPSTVYVTQPSVVYSQPAVIDQSAYAVQQPQPTFVTAPAPVIVQQPQPAPTAVYSSTQFPTQPQQPQAAPEAGRYQDRDLGDAYLRLADFSNASRVYQRYLTAWNADGTVNRNLGLALIGRGEVQDGFRAVVQGYRLEPTLFDRPMRVSDLGGGAGFQSLLDAASRGASGTNTAEGWFTLAMLNNFAGNRDGAINALQRSRDAGLDTTLLDAATLRLSQPTR